MTKNFITNARHANRSLVSMKQNRFHVSNVIFSQIQDLTAPVIGSFLGKNYFFKKSKHQLSLLHRYLLFLNLANKRDLDAPSNKQAQLYFHSYCPQSKHDLHNAVISLGGNRIYGINEKTLLGWLLRKYQNHIVHKTGIDCLHLINCYGHIGSFLVFQAGSDYRYITSRDLLESINHDLFGGAMSDMHCHAVSCFLLYANRILRSYSVNDLRKRGVNFE